VTSVAEALKRLPAGNVGAFNENTVASFTPGAAGVSLRGLGAQATLVLIDGRRTAPYGLAANGQQTFVDVNTIPLEMVERIEVLLDGASAIYGSDAIGGVVNIILKKDYTGTQLAAGYGLTSRSDGQSKRLSFTVGRGSLAADNYNFFANITHEDQASVKASRRPNTRTADYTRFGLADTRSEYSYPGNLYDPNDPYDFISPMPGCTPVSDGSDLNGRCVLQRVRYADIQAKAQRDSLFLGGTLELSGGAELFGNLSVNHVKARLDDVGYTTGTYASRGIETLPFDAITLPPGHPSNPYPASLYPNGVDLRYRFADVPQSAEIDNTLSRFIVGGRGSYSGWDLESALVYAHTRVTFDSTGLLRDSVLQTIVDPASGVASTSPGSTFIFGNPSANDPALLAALYPRLRSVGTTSTTSVDLRGTREVFQLPAGGVGLALGVEARREQYKNTPDPLVAAGEISVVATSGADSSRGVESAYAELSIPILRTLEASLAGRIDHYSDFGSASTPKVGLKWKALPNLAFRATWAKGFRAPALTETSAFKSTGFFVLQDPVFCPVYDPGNTNCEVGVKGDTSSNPDLKPERSTSLTFGLVFDVNDDWSVTANVFRVKRVNEITYRNPDTVLANESQFPGVVTRDPATNEITGLRLQLTNLGSTEVMGYDLELRGKLNAAEYGKFDFLGTFNYLPYYRVAETAGSATQNYAGYYLQPKQRWQLTTGWEKGPWSHALTMNYVGSYLLRQNPSSPPCAYDQDAPNRCTIGSWPTFDLVLGYKGVKNLELGLVINNLFDRQAPIDGSPYQRATLYEPSFHSALGRAFALRGKYTF
jgi:iron complex outermembrane receptor protein